MAEQSEDQKNDNRKRIRVKTGRRKAKKRVWKTKWVKVPGGGASKAAASK